MTDWLAPVRAALGARLTPLPCFVRDDDGGWDDSRLLALLDLFERHAMPIDVAVIPDALGDSMADELTARSTIGRVHLHQHGRSHVNHEPPDRRKCEFGPARPIDAIRADVRAGRDRLRALLGDALEPVFTPPWNRCVDELAEALADAGITVLSRDHTAGRIDHPAIAEVPVSIDWFGRSKGERWTPTQLGERVATALRGDEPFGLMLHHGVTDGVELARIDALVGLLATHPMVAATSIVEAAAASAQASAVGA